MGVADDGQAPEGEPLKYPLLGPLEHLGKIVEEVRADRIIVALTERRGRMPMRQLLDAEARGILVEDGMATYEQFTGKLAIEALSPSFLVFSSGFRKTPGQLGRQRVVSLVAAAVGLVVTAPLMALIALAIKLDSRGPVFFVHERAGSAAASSGSSSSAPCAANPSGATTRSGSATTKTGSRGSAAGCASSDSTSCPSSGTSSRATWTWSGRGPRSRRTSRT